MLNAAAAMHDCRVEVSPRGEAGVNRNYPELVSRVERICHDNGIPTVVFDGDGPKASEDFAWICKTVRGAEGQSCYFNVVSTCPANVHQPTFDFEETALINSVKTFVLTVMDLLK
ncbi:MAG: hypothetical protein SPE74_05180 [Oscillospiraceae bacterium]|nr:hypothetical protein [Oscillospiraceae bacterium]